MKKDRVQSRVFSRILVVQNDKRARRKYDAIQKMTYMRRVCGNTKFTNWLRTSQHCNSSIIHCTRHITCSRLKQSRRKSSSRRGRRWNSWEAYARLHLGGGEEEIGIATGDNDELALALALSLSISRPGAQSSRKNSIVSFRFYGAVTRKISSSRIRTGKKTSGGRETARISRAESSFRAKYTWLCKYPGSSIREERDMHLSECRAWRGLQAAHRTDRIYTHSPSSVFHKIERYRSRIIELNENKKDINAKKNLRVAVS